MTFVKRRFRYSLRSLFIVLTLLCLWIGWHAQRQWQRREFIAYLESLEFDHYSETAFVEIRPNGSELPTMWRLLGAKPVTWTKVVNDSQLGAAELQKRAARLLPEMDAEIYSPGE